MFHFQLRLITTVMAAAFAPSLHAQQNNAENTPPSAEAKPIVSTPTNSVVMPRIDVIGSYENLKTISGSADVIDKETLESSRVFTANEALRKVPGVHMRDEEGLGLRPNIGIRGLNPTRSTKVTLLEDGIPLAYAPYGDNASYFHPPIERFDHIEILKGADQVRFGPQTIGGVVNYITPNSSRKTWRLYSGYWR